jgi:recombination protein RecA
MGKKRNKKQKLDMAVTHIHRRFGSRSLIRGRLPTANNTVSTIPCIPSGFPQLDQALGIDGWPKGRVSEIVGLPTSGKTTLAFKFLAQAQADGGQVVYVDQARSFDPDYAHRCGLDLSRFQVGMPYDLQEALAMTEALARSGELSAIVFDALEIFWIDPESVRYLNAMLSHLGASLARSGTALLFLQTAAADGSSVIPVLAHYASVRLQVMRERWLRHGGDVRGYEARVKVLKNRFGPADQFAVLKIAFNGAVRGDDLG